MGANSTDSDRQRPARKSYSPAPSLGHSGVRYTQEAAIQCAMLSVVSSAGAAIEVTTSVRRLQVAFLPFARRWPRMSGLTVRECVLPTLSGHSTHRRFTGRYLSGAVALLHPTGLKFFFEVTLHQPELMARMRVSPSRDGGFTQHRWTATGRRTKPLAR
jgi:hypothetical protein